MENNVFRINGMKAGMGDVRKRDLTRMIALNEIQTVVRNGFKDKIIATR